MSPEAPVGGGGSMAEGLSRGNAEAQNGESDDPQAQALHLLHFSLIFFEERD